MKLTTDFPKDTGKQTSGKNTGAFTDFRRFTQILTAKKLTTKARRHEDELDTD